MEVSTLLYAWNPEDSTYVVIKVTFNTIAKVSSNVTFSIPGIDPLQINKEDLKVLGDLLRNEQ